jgi:hypothetical protein
MEFIGNSLGNGDGGQAAGLSTGDFASAALASFQTHLGQLSAFAATSFTRNNYYPVIFDGLNNLLSVPDNRQLRRVIEARFFSLAGQFFLNRLFQPFFEIHKNFSGFSRTFPLKVRRNKPDHSFPGIIGIPEHGFGGQRNNLLAKGKEIGGSGLGLVRAGLLILLVSHQLLLTPFFYYTKTI